MTAARRWHTAHGVLGKSFAELIEAIHHRRSGVPGSAGWISLKEDARPTRWLKVRGLRSRNSIPSVDPPVTEHTVAVIHSQGSRNQSILTPAEPGERMPFGTPRDDTSAGASQLPARLSRATGSAMCSRIWSMTIVSKRVTGSNSSNSACTFVRQETRDSGQQLAGTSTTSGTKNHRISLRVITPSAGRARRPRGPAGAV